MEDRLVVYGAKVTLVGNAGGFYAGGCRRVVHFASDGGKAMVGMNDSN